MFHSIPAIGLALAAAGICGAALAQSSNTAVPAAPAAYQSAVEGYKPFTEEKTAPWTESNITVGKVGGWRAYAKEAGEGQKAAQPADTAAPASGHKH